MRDCPSLPNKEFKIQVLRNIDFSSFFSISLSNTVLLNTQSWDPAGRGGDTTLCTREGHSVWTEKFCHVVQKLYRGSQGGRNRGQAVGGLAIQV